MRKWLEPPEGSYLRHEVEVDVRFQEVDPLQVVWHGHYVTYFEDARVAFGRRYGISYEQLRAAGLAAPIVRLECDYLAPARFGDVLVISVRLYRRESAKLDFLYTVSRKADSAVLAVGRTLQVFSDVEGNMVLTTPAILRDTYDKWAAEMIDE